MPTTPPTPEVREGHSPAGANASFTGAGRTLLRDLRTLQDFAIARGVQVDTIHAYRARGRLPEPIGYVGITPVWSAAQVKDWAAQPSTPARTVPTPTR